MREPPTWTDNYGTTIDTRPQRIRDEQERLFWQRRRKRPPTPLGPPVPDDDPWAKPPPKDPFAESQALHNPKGPPAA